VFSTNRKGAIAEAEIAVAAVRLGIPVYVPVAEHGRSDLVLEIAGRLLRTQCKWGALDTSGNVIKVSLQTSRFTPNGYVHTSYSDNEIDLVAAYCGGVDRCYLLPRELVTRRNAISLRLTPPRNGQRACINLASDFEFAGAVAQLEERLAGSEEARGSSPLSSTPSNAAASSHVIGSNPFRNHFGYWLERAAAGEDVIVTFRGKPRVRLSAT
jgi:hypothetical protein